MATEQDESINIYQSGATQAQFRMGQAALEKSFIKPALRKEVALRSMGLPTKQIFPDFSSAMTAAGDFGLKHAGLEERKRQFDTQQAWREKMDREGKPSSWEGFLGALSGIVAGTDAIGQIADWFGIGEGAAGEFWDIFGGLLGGSDAGTGDSGDFDETQYDPASQEPDAPPGGGTPYPTDSDFQDDAYEYYDDFGYDQDTEAIPGGDVNPPALTEPDIVPEVQPEPTVDPVLAQDDPNQPTNITNVTNVENEEDSNAFLQGILGAGIGNVVKDVIGGGADSGGGDVKDIASSIALKEGGKAITGGLNPAIGAALTNPITAGVVGTALLLPTVGGAINKFARKHFLGGGTANPGSMALLDAYDNKTGVWSSDGGLWYTPEQVKEMLSNPMFLRSLREEKVNRLSGRWIAEEGGAAPHIGQLTDPVIAAKSPEARDYAMEHELIPEAEKITFMEPTLPGTPHDPFETATPEFMAAWRKRESELGGG